ARSTIASGTTARAARARAPLSFARSFLEAPGFGVVGLDGRAGADFRLLGGLPAHDRHDIWPNVLAEGLVRASNHPAAGNKDDLPRRRAIRMRAFMGQPLPVHVGAHRGPFVVRVA